MEKKNIKGDTISVVEAGMTLIIKVKESEWKELKTSRNEGLFYQFGTGLILFSASLLVTLLTAQMCYTIRIVLWSIFAATFSVGVLLMILWHNEYRKKKHVVTKIETRAKEQYGDNIEL